MKYTACITIIYLTGIIFITFSYVFNFLADTRQMIKKNSKKLESLVDLATQNRLVASVNISSRAMKMRNIMALVTVTFLNLAASQTYCYAVNVIRKLVPARTDRKRLALIVVDTSKNVSTINYKNQEPLAHIEAQVTSLPPGRYIMIRIIAVNLLRLNHCIVIKNIKLEEAGRKSMNRSMTEETTKIET